MQERRTRISGKLKKLQDLVPNMDKVQFVFLDLLVFAHSFHVNFFGKEKCHEKCLYGVGGGGSVIKF